MQGKVGTTVKVGTQGCRYHRSPGADCAADRASRCSKERFGMHTINRRRFERFNLPCAYSAVAVRLMDSERFEHEGHAYDISEGGIQFELDRGIEPGTPVAMRVDLPTSMLSDDMGPGRSVFLMGNVVWLDDSDAGPARMALAITRFAREGDRERLIRAFAARRLTRAA